MAEIDPEIEAWKKLRKMSQLPTSERIGTVVDGWKDDDDAEPVYVIRLASGELVTALESEMELVRIH